MNDYPCNISHIQERTLVARVQVDTATGKHWFLVEVEDAFLRRGLRMAAVSTLPLVNGHQPEIFLQATHGGFGYATREDVLCSQLHDIAVVADGQVIEYLGRPFSPAGSLVVDIPQLASVN